MAEKIKEDPKSFYAYVRSKQKVREGIGPLTTVTGILSVSDNEKCNILNDYFQSVFTIEDTICDLNIEMESKTDPSTELNNICISRDNIIKAINGMKENKTGGGDEIPSTLIIRLRDELTEPLYIIFNSSFELNQVPDDWKSANVTAIFKSGSKKEASNYRPISLTSQFGELFEKIIKLQLVEYLEKTRLLT